MSNSTLRPHYAPKVPAGWIVRLYKTDALGVRNEELVAKVGWRLLSAPAAGPQGSLVIMRVSQSCT